MGKIAFVFAGQGAQAPGMGRELYASSPGARRVLDQAEALRPGTLRQCFEGSPQELVVTENTQPCLFAVELACAAAALEAGARPRLCAGFSLGEAAAAAFCGMLPEGRAFAFVLERAAAMQACAQKHPGFMAAVVRLEVEQVVALCRGFEDIYPGNFNAPGQVVVSGAASGRDAFFQAVAAAGGRAIPLKVRGAFHSPLMGEAAQRLLVWLRGEALQAPSMPLYANRTALPYGEGEDAAQLLAQQVDHPVLWEKTVRAMGAAGADLFVELGPGGVLSGLIRKILPEARVCRVEDAKSLREAAALWEGRSA